jgi:haloalkane dehalogenase
MKNLLLNILLMTALATVSHAQKISDKFPFESKFQKIGNDNIHYIDEGTGDPILFLHGIPMSSYSWRNVIPHLTDTARCIAIDFMGFGKSDKPKIGYTFVEQYNYLVGFIDSLKLQNVTLVMTDIGGILGTKYAMDHPSKVKGLAFMETPFSDAQTFHKNGGMMQHMMFWMGGKDKMGYRMIVKKNMFIKMMGMLIKRRLNPTEKSNYLKPFETKESRLPLFVLPNSFPRKGKNPKSGDMADFMNKNNVKLQESDVPKLLVYAKPGMLVNKKVLKWVKENLTNMQTQYVGKAKHLMEEDLPNEIGCAIRNWYAQLSTEKK